MRILSICVLIVVVQDLAMCTQSLGKWNLGCRKESRVGDPGFTPLGAFPSFQIGLHDRHLEQLEKVLTQNCKFSYVS